LEVLKQQQQQQQQQQKPQMLTTPPSRFGFTWSEVELGHNWVIFINRVTFLRNLGAMVP
jgi:hypothetical protein